MCVSAAWEVVLMCVLAVKSCKVCQCCVESYNVRQCYGKL